MPVNAPIQPEYRGYTVWDSPTRWFHWINALAVLGLLVTGLVILTAGQLGLSSEGKITLKETHALFGYVLALNLLWRFIWAFFGNRYARWKAILPGGRGYGAALRAYAASFLTGEPEQYVGHNPLARIGVTMLLFLLLVQTVTGLVLAGADLYWPPFGGLVADWVAAPGVDPGTLVPGTKDLIDVTAYQAMRDLRGPIVETHEIVFYLIAVGVALHLIAVVVTEIHEGGSIVSAMFTGRKILTKKPPDEV
ncbi:cytochrome b/b6 domain-containing protein [Methyloligella solikamskensis]|uniref:Cytochrome b/b6 domain-containing protein n=1 Tax=Methyloligella solikamskensis TaxID=1177756 RepID=A0ABW3JCN0_9HYPH